MTSWRLAVPSSSKDDVKVVEEVMRSCGGAVQGVRDVSSLYLNRADDGFVFFDCGSYTHGPVTLAVANENVFTTTIMLSNKCRVLLSCTLDVETKESKMDSAYVLRRVTFGDDGSSLVAADFECGILEQAPLDVTWHERIQCRMSSPGQPWMMQRAQWENEVSSDSSSIDFQQIGNLQAWTSVQSQNDLDDTGVGGLTLTAGVMSTESGCVKAITRKYNDNHMLTQVILKSGATKADDSLLTDIARAAYS